jgi:hypothetical protein
MIWGQGEKGQGCMTLYLKMDFFINYWTAHRPLTFKLYRYIAFGQKITSMDFCVNGSEVKITLTLKVTMFSDQYPSLLTLYLQTSQVH